MKGQPCCRDTKQRVQQLALLLFCLLAVGCQWIWVRKVHLETHLTNDDNRLLNIEGSCNLPESALIEARLSDASGRRWASGTGAVVKGQFFVVLDISRCPGFRALTLNLTFDPLLASARVQQETGPRGEALGGPFVHESHDRNLVSSQQHIMLQMTQREAALRRLEQGDGDVKELESFISRHPDDGQALIGLGLAYLKQRPSERHPGSQAHTLLERGLASSPNSPTLELEARTWVSRLKMEADANAALRERMRKPDPTALLNREALVIPGEALGIIRIGMQLRFLLRHFPLDHAPDTSRQDGIDTFHVEGRPDLEIKVDRATNTVVSASSDSKFFHLASGLSVGSMLDDLRAVVPDINVAYGADKTGDDGRLRAEGTVELEGLTLTVQRLVNPEFPLPMETIVRLEVTRKEP